MKNIKIQIEKKSQSIVIDKNGNLVDPSEYINDSQNFDPKLKASLDFKILVEREALGIGNKEILDKSIVQPEYLNYAHKLGFRWEQNAPIGFMSCDYKANLIMRLVKEYARECALNIGIPIYENSGSRVFDMSHEVVKAYANLYGERLLSSDIGNDRKIVFGYDGSYPQFNLASQYRMSYKQLPFAHFSLAECYRNEQSGECMLFYRGRQFNMPDLHPYFKNIEESWDGFIKIEKQILKVARDINREFVISGCVSSPKYFEMYKDEIKQIAVRNNQDILVEILPVGSSKYWIINFDYKIIDAMSQSREISCIQIDVENAKRLGIFYVDKDNSKKNPIIIHSAVSGGIERYLYMLFDNFQNNFPLWLHPIQLRLIPVGEKHIKFCEDLLEKHKNLQIRIDIDDRSESVSKKVKFAKESFIPNIFVIGDNEVNLLSELDILLQNIQKQIKDKPFIPIQWPRLVSQQIV